MKKLSLHPQRLTTGIALLTLSLGCAKVNFADDTQSQQSVQAVTKTVSSSQTVTPYNKQVDFLLVLDDSNSMLPELKKLSARMSSFVNFLEANQIDWQMCVTTTRGSHFGQYLSWNNYLPPSGSPNFVLARGTSNLSTIFTSTINSISIGGSESADERAIKAAFVSFASGGSCYRPGAAVSVIAISDEDERSVGGDPNKVKKKDAAGVLLPLEPEDLPANLIAQAQNSFGSNVRFTFNSIIVKPGDLACEKKQDTEDSPSHVGYTYAALSQLTNGGVGSICDADYSANLNTFKNKVVNSLNQINMQCEPVSGSVKVWVNKRLVSNYRTEKRALYFDRELTEGTLIDLVYDCQE